MSSYGIQMGKRGTFVQRLVFNDEGLHVDFTRLKKDAAHISHIELAERLCGCLPGGIVVDLSTAKVKP